jgi:hypothetical protein
MVDRILQQSIHRKWQQQYRDGRIGTNHSTTQWRCIAQHFIHGSRSSGEQIREKQMPRHRWYHSGNDAGWWREGDICNLQSDMARGESTCRVDTINHHHNTKERRLDRIQQLQNNCSAKSHVIGVDDGAVGEVESTDGAISLRRASRIQARQEHNASDTDPKIKCRVG